MCNTRRRFVSLVFLCWIIALCDGESKKEESFPAEFDFRIISYDELTSEAPVFNNENIVGYTQLTLDEGYGQLLVGARDRLFRLSLDDLSPLEEADISAPFYKQDICKKKGQPEDYCYNYVRVLLLHNYTQTNSNSDVEHAVYVCGTNAFSPSCTWRPANNLSSSLVEENGIGKSPYNPFHNSTALITSEGDFYGATMIDPGNRDPAIYRSKGSSYLRTIQSNSKWLNEPDFISAYEIGEFVYFFFREVAVEFINCGKRIYSRVARLCKSDEGSTFTNAWTTYYKSRLNCSLPGEYPFYYDELQSTYLLEEGPEKYLYAVFTTSASSIAGSAVCVYNMTAFNNSFTGPYKYQENPRAAWEKHDNPKPLTQCEVKKETNKRHTGDNEMIDLKYQLMDHAVQPVNKTPLLHTEGERWTHVVVDNVKAKNGTYKVVFVATEDGKLLKKTQLLSTKETCLIEEIKIVPNGEPRPVKNIKISSETGAIFITTHESIIKVPVERCSRLTDSDLCQNANDPYCGWDDDSHRCTTAPSGQPEVHYWKQSMKSCPFVHHAVDGDWSAWSSWGMCNQVGGDPSAGNCLCRMRSCDNPKPYYGGHDCVGSSVEVTNCTTHGQWTVWTAWSACTQSCGSTATHRRSRLCSNPPPRFGGRKCLGPDTEEDYCVGHPPCPLPPVQSNWTEWTDWNQCSAHCNGGIQSRRRMCNKPPPSVPNMPCLGDAVEWTTCNNHICEVLSMMTPWTPWLTVNQTKGGGFEQRYRFLCRAKVPSQSSLIRATSLKPQTRFCVEGECHSSENYTLTHIDGGWSDWSTWTACSLKCDGGYRWRSRKCDDPAPFGEGKDCLGHTMEGQECNAHSCQGVWSCWTEMSTCSVSCGEGIKYRSRQCQSLPPGHSYNIPCTGNAEDIISCDMSPCIDVSVAQSSVQTSAFNELRFSLGQLFLVGGLCFIFGGSASLALYAYISSFRRAMIDAKKQEKLEKLQKSLQQQRDLQRRISKASMRPLPSLASQASLEHFLSHKNNRVYDVETVMRESMYDKEDFNCSTLDRQCALRTFTVKDLGTA